MKIRKLNEWKCGMDINDVGVYPEGILKDMVDKFELKYNPSTGCYDCDCDVDLYDYYYGLRATEQNEFDAAFVSNGKMTIRFGNVKGDFYLPGDADTPYIITSLEGCPKKVGGSFDCRNNQLTSLKGCPKTVGGSFCCSYNRLTSLKGCPKTIGRDFNCAYNQLTSLEGCPKTVGNDFYCYTNKADFTEEYVRSVCDVKNNIYA